MTYIPEVLTSYAHSMMETQFSLGIRIKCHSQQTDFLFTCWFAGIHFQEATSISSLMKTITVCPGRNAKASFMAQDVIYPGEGSMCA